MFVFYDNGVDSTEVPELRAQRVNTNGELMWPGNGVLITDEFTSANVTIPNQAVSDGLGNTIILYSDSSGTKLQKVNGQGELLWGEGLNILPVGRQMIGDNFGAAITAGVRQMFDGISLKYIVGAQKIDANGQVLWGEQGVAVDSLEDRTNPGITLNKNSQVAFVWQQNVNDTLDVFLNKISTTGDLIFPQEIEVSKFKSRKVAPNVVPSANSSEIVIWYDYRNSDGGLFSPDALFAQRIGENSNPLWSESDIEVSISEVQHRSFQVVSDQAGGAIIIWYEVGTGSGFGIFAQQISRDGNLGEVLITSVSQPDETSVPYQYILRQSYPNPFNAEMLIKYENPENNFVTLTIYDITGKEVIKLVDKKQPPGTYQVTWNGQNDKGGDVATGLYFFQLRAGSFVETKKALLIK